MGIPFLFLIQKDRPSMPAVGDGVGLIIRDPLKEDVGVQ